MTDDDGKRPQVGVVVTLRDMGDGKTRVILDDVKSDSPCREASWSFDLFYTHKDLETAAVDSMELPSAEYEGLGAAIIARLRADWASILISRPPGSGPSQRPASGR